MRTAVQDTSIGAFHTVVPDFEGAQFQRILNYISQYGPSTIGEIAHGLNMEKSTVSARQNALRQAKQLTLEIDRRHCKISGVLCNVLKFPQAQGSLFN